MVSPRAWRSSASNRAIQHPDFLEERDVVAEVGEVAVLGQMAYIRASWAAAWRNRSARFGSPSSTWLPGLDGSRR